MSQFEMTLAETLEGFGRHPGVVSIAKHFQFDHLPEHLQAISKPCHDLAVAMTDELHDGPELTAGLRKLLEAKDCFVRAAIEECAA
jgi:hypothetical protein